MRRSQTRFVQSGGSEATISWKSSASATRSSLAGLPRIGPVTVATEYELLRGSAGVVDRSERGKLLLTGAEAAEFLQGQLTNDIESLAPGSGCYAALLTHKGKL